MADDRTLARFEGLMKIKLAEMAKRLDAMEAQIAALVAERETGEGESGRRRRERAA